MVREAAWKNNDIAGDGTTTVVVLAQAIVRARWQSGLQDGRAYVDKAVRSMNWAKRSRKITTKAETAQCRQIFANGELIG